MFAFIEGLLIEKNPAYAVLDNNGIGYMINISLNTYSKIKDLERCRLYTHFIVRDDAHLLFGFADKEERRIFRELISISGIGANTARIVLSSLTAAEVINAITSGNISALQSVKGIGTKSAQRIIVELKDRLAKDVPAGDIYEQTYNTLREQALSGLIMLGFNKKLAEKALDTVLKSDGQLKFSEQEGLTVEELIKLALKLL